MMQNLASFFKIGRSAHPQPRPSEFSESAETGSDSTLGGELSLLRKKTAMKDKLQSEKCARLLKALADPDRLKIIQCLQSGPKNVGHIATMLDAQIANISHHLGVLRVAGLVEDVKQGKFVCYNLTPDYLQGSNVLDFGCCRIELGKE